MFKYFWLTFSDTPQNCIYRHVFHIQEKTTQKFIIYHSREEFYRDIMPKIIGKTLNFLSDMGRVSNL